MKGGDQGEVEEREKGVREKEGPRPTPHPQTYFCLLIESLGGCRHLAPRPSSLPRSLPDTQIIRKSLKVLEPRKGQQHDQHNIDIARASATNSTALAEYKVIREGTVFTCWACVGWKPGSGW